MPAGRKAVNLSADAAPLREARDLHINLSTTLERALEDALRRKSWDHRLAICRTSAH